MRSIQGTLAALVASITAGSCYQAQDVLFTMDAGRGGAEDAGRRWEGGPPPTVDAALPPIDEPDVGPDERPSDDPSAGGWIDPPPASSDPCCDVGELVGLGDPSRQAFPPLVAWGGDAWGVAWADQAAPVFDHETDPDHALFAQLDTDARPIMPTARIWGLGRPFALAYASGRYAIAAFPPGINTDFSYLGVLHPAGALVDYVAVDVGEQIQDVSRFPAAHAWVVMTRRGPGASLRRYDDALDPVGDPIPLGDIRADYGATLVALKSRLVAVVPTREGVQHATFAGSELEPIGAGLLVRPGTYRSEYGVDELGVATAATAMRDTVVAIAMDTTDLWSVVYDPFRGEVVSGPMRIARSPAYLGHDVAGDHEGGTVGVCYPDGDAPYGGYHGDPPTPGPAPDRVRFALLGPDGAPLGTAVTIASGLLNAVSCSIACVGRDRYAVALWDADGLDPGFAIFAATVRVRR